MSLEVNKIYNMDCLEGMKEIEDGSIDMILCDLPYGTTACKWDAIIPFEPLWEQYERIVKPNGAIVLTASQPFTTSLISSNYKMFKYCWVWDKKIPGGMSYARYQPMRQHEDILVFYKGRPVYNPQMVKRDKPIKKGGNKYSETAPIQACKEGKEFRKTYEYKNPTTILTFNKVRKGTVHPTQKPVALFEYLIKTYTNEGDLVLDNCIGSGTTAIAALNTHRNFIGFELDKGYFDIANQRIASSVCHE